MRYGWFLRGKRSQKLVRVHGENVFAVEAPADATMFASAEAAHAFAHTLIMAPELEIVDYAIHDPLPADADQSSVRTRAQVIQDAKDEDRPREAQRRATWGLVEKAVAVVGAVIATSLLLFGADPATASPRDNLFPPLYRSVDHANHRPGAYHSRSAHAHAPRNVVGWSHEPRPGFDRAGSAAVIHDVSSAVAVAERYLGGNPTGRASLWCADFANFVERQLGRAGTGSREAKSFLHYGEHVGNPRPGDIVVFSRGSGGHVGYLIKQTIAGPLVVSGNHGHAVGIGVYPAARVLAYVRPS